MIEVRKLSAGYRERRILQDVSLTLPDGCVTVLIGPNGSGKSTLLKVMAGLLPAEDGELTVDGFQQRDLAPRLLARRVAYLAQSRNVPNITAYRMVLHGRFPYLSYPRRYGRDDHAAAAEALRRMGAEDLADTLLPRLSGGQRQRVYLAMALAQDTPNVLMDEPTTFLDVGHQLEVMETARQLAGAGQAVCMVLHDLCLALRIADQTVLLEEGRVRFAGPPEELYQTGLIKEVFGVAAARTFTEHGWQYYYEDRL